jgi:two-component system, NarL family, sensor histidine kinase DevS
VEHDGGIVVRPKDRNTKLLDAGLHLASELSLPAVLQRIVELAAEVTDARYGALGVLGPDGRIIEFVTHGVTAEQRAHIGALPVGRGLLGALITDARPLRTREISQDPRSVGFPPNHPEMHSFLGAPVKARGRVFGNVYLTEKQGAEEFSEEDEQALVILAAQAGVAVENSHLYEEARQRERRLEAVREISASILEGDSRSRILHLVAERARELMAASVATVAIPADDPSELVLEVAVGEGADALRGRTFHTSDSVSGEVIETGRPVVLADAAADPRAAQPLVAEAMVGPAMFVPLFSKGEPFGTLALGTPVGGHLFSEEDLTLVRTFADQASVALEYSRIQGELRRLAVMEDRERIAKELHDGAIQSLFAVGMGLQATAQMSRDSAIEQRIDHAVNEVDRVIRDLRNYIFGLRPGILADRQLDQALRRLAEEFQERTEVTTVVDVDAGAAAELSSQAGDLVQFARETLSNVGRHASATTCRVALFRRDGEAVLEIDDDGTGFDLESPGTGHGLTNLRERAKSVGGEMKIESTPGAGTTVRLSIPL